MTGGEYTEAQLRADYGGWRIWWRDYMDGPYLAAVPLDATSEFIPFARRTPAAMRDCLAAFERRSLPAVPGQGSLPGEK